MKTFVATLSALALIFLPSTSRGQDPIKALEDERLSQSGVAITIVFDDSGSMASDNRMTQAKSALTQWLGGIPESTKLALIALNRGVLVPLGQNNRDTIKSAVAEIEPNGGTPLTRTINQAGKMIQERRKNVTPYERHIVVVFTDGRDSNFSDQQVVEALRQLGKATIETVGIGFHGEGDYMREGATQYYNAGDSEELVSALKEVASEVDQQSDIVISPEIQGEMEKVPAVSQIPEIVVPSPTPARGLFSMKTVVIVGILIVVLVKWITRKGSGSRS